MIHRLPSPRDCFRPASASWPAASAPLQFSSVWLGGLCDFHFRIISVPTVSCVVTPAMSSSSSKPLCPSLSSPLSRPLSPCFLRDFSLAWRHCASTHSPSRLIPRFCLVAPLCSHSQRPTSWLVLDTSRRRPLTFTVPHASFFGRAPFPCPCYFLLRYSAPAALRLPSFWWRLV